MFILKGFINYPSMANNKVGETAPLGEISTDSMTYAKEVGQYNRDLQPDTLLYSFESRNDAGELVRVPVAQSEAALKVGQWVFDNAQSGSLTKSRTNFLQQLTTEFSGVIEDTDAGQMLTDDSVWMPEWVSYRLTGVDSYIKLWFSDDAFGGQYDGYEIEVVCPIENVDDFFGTRDQVQNILKQRTPRDIVLITEQKRGEAPYTVLRSDEFDWIDRFSGDDFEVPTYWTTLIWGRAGDNIDVIRETLQAWILDHSEYTRDEWVDVLPDIFAATEYIITPMFSQYAIPNQTIQAGIYSPIVEYGDILPLAKATAIGTGYKEADVIANTSVSFTPYKSMAFIVTGSSENRDGITTFGKRFPDYIAVSTQHHDFSRMSPETQGWVRMLQEMIQHAEELTEYNSIPPGFSRMEREGVLYLVGTYDGIQYLVVSRHSMMTLVAPHTWRTK